MFLFIAGIGTGVFITWVSAMIGIEQKAYKELIKEDAYNEILNENEHYKKIYWDYRAEQDADYWG